MFEFGHLLKCYYRLRSVARFGESLRYSFGFEGYVDHLRGLHRNVARKRLAFVRFRQDGAGAEEEGAGDEAGEGAGDEANVSFVDQAYAGFRRDQDAHAVVKTDCRLQPNIILSGPNASGKTTFLKTTLLNLLFTQQVGCGFYGAGSSIGHLYTHVHSYLNIPDTSERDSLFQAESRRCKEIIDKIEAGGFTTTTQRRRRRHFCIFDELYSGTNPQDAVRTATGFLKYLLKRDNVEFILTTHYEDICRNFEQQPRVLNFQMDVREEDHDHDLDQDKDQDQDQKEKSLVYTYRVKPGISQVHGSVNILRKMNYPSEILDEL